MHFIYTERGPEKKREYTILRDGVPAWEIDPGIIVEAYKALLGNPVFMWPDFYDRMVVDHNENALMTMRGSANSTVMAIKSDPELLIPSRQEMQGYINAVSLDIGAQLPEIVEAAVRKVLKEKEGK